MHVVLAGPDDGPPIMLLHGFPEFWYSWRYQIPALAAAGYRVIAPDQRGYNLSGKRGPYDLGTLIGDIESLRKALGIERAHVVGHDWGGVVAWAFAATFLERVDKLIILNAPHPSAYRDTLNRSRRQLLKSWYIAFFQLPLLPELALRLGGQLVLRRAYEQVNREHMSEDDVAAYLRAFQQPGALTATLGWYRALARDMLAHWSSAPSYHIDAPTCVIWGERDSFLDKSCNETLERYVPDLALHYMPEATHWVQMDQPEMVNRLLLAFLGRETGG